jgi:hypothetical protein
MNVPKPDDQGTRHLPDGSRIFTSGNDYTDKGVHVHMPDAGKFMLWVKTGTEMVDGRKRNIGDFVMGRTGPMYFDTPLKAMGHWQETNHGN